MPASKTALITGATDDVGRVVAKRLAKDGWRVLVHGRSAEVHGGGDASAIVGPGEGVGEELVDDLGQPE